MRPLLIPVTMNLGVMAIKEYIIFPNSLGLKPHHKIQFSVIPKTKLEIQLTYHDPPLEWWLLIDVSLCI